MNPYQEHLEAFQESDRVSREASVRNRLLQGRRGAPAKASPVAPTPPPQPTPPQPPANDPESLVGQFIFFLDAPRALHTPQASWDPSKQAAEIEQAQNSPKVRKRLRARVTRVLPGGLLEVSLPTGGYAKVDPKDIVD